ncbi:MAG: NADP-dependent isocitrate dehydrogenase, partial [Alphaproteobacteria bacterium]
DGNSWRAVTQPVADAAKKYFKPDNQWNQKSRTHVASMDRGDFYANEVSKTVESAQAVSIKFTGEDGKTIDLGDEDIQLHAGEIVGATFMSREALKASVKESIQAAKDKDLLFSVHLKATMMKVSDPEIFGVYVETFFEDVFKNHAEVFGKLGVNPNDGVEGIYNTFKTHMLEELAKENDIEFKRLHEEFQNLEGADFVKAVEDNISALPGHISSRAVGLALHLRDVHRDIERTLKTGPELYTTHTKKGLVHNLWTPGAVIVDASIPKIFLKGGKATGADGKTLKEVQINVPDRTYGQFYDAVAENLKTKGAIDPAKAGSVYNVGLMGDKAEEYGSHNVTFMAPGNGTISITGKDGQIHQHKVQKGDIWRMNRARDTAIKNWVNLTIQKMADMPPGTEAVFVLDEGRAHDREVKAKIEAYLDDINIAPHSSIKIMSYKEAANYTTDRMRDGKNTITATGNVLRDYLTDLYPILQIGNSNEMESETSYPSGGSMFETGSGGTAGDLLENLVEKNHFTWGEEGTIIALSGALRKLNQTCGHVKALIMADALDKANVRFLEKEQEYKNNGGLDTRKAHVWLPLYWAEELAAQDEDQELKAEFSKKAQLLRENLAVIFAELSAGDGQAVPQKMLNTEEGLRKVMRPSTTYNEIFPEMPMAA